MEQSEKESNRRYKESREKRSLRSSEEYDRNERDRERDSHRYRERERDKSRFSERERSNNIYETHDRERKKWNYEDSKEFKEKEKKYSKDSSYYGKCQNSKKELVDYWEEKYSEESSDSYEAPETTKNHGSLIPINLESEQTPNNTLMIRGLAQHIVESDIRQDIIHCGLMPKDIRLIRKKDTGSSRGFAFVEFNTVQEATRWMEMKKGILMLHDQYRAIIHYSIPKESYIDRTAQKPIHDWYCVKCGAHNFKRRDSCFKCQASRQESEEGGEGSDEICFHPTKMILLRSLDVLTTEDGVKSALNIYSNLIPKSIRIAQDHLTNTSRGICYIEMNCILDAMNLSKEFSEKPFIVDGRKLVFSYCKTEYPMPTWKQLPNGEMGSQYTAEDIPRLSEYCASLYANTIEQFQSYEQYYENYFQTQLAQGGVISLPVQRQGEFTNPTTSTLAQTAIQQGHSAKNASESKTTIYSLQTKVPNCPVISKSDFDFSTYQYDKSSGYYYDAEAGLYYDPTSQYFYNPQTKQFLFWDSKNQTYVPVSMDQANNLNSVIKDECNKKEKDKSNKQNKVKVAKKIAKDMEKWAKTLNQKKDVSRFNVNQSMNNQEQKSCGAADAGYAILERNDSLVSPSHSQQDNFMSVLQNSSPQAVGLVASYESDEEIEDVLQEEKQHTNWSKLACLLCKRQFSSKDALIRHQQLSVLHNQNLEEWYKVRGLDPHDPQQRNIKYRDRAKERRKKFGEPETQHPNHLKEKYLKVKENEVINSYQEPTKEGIGSDNVGNKLLQKMGWQEGMGLGKTNQGRTSIIEAKKKSNSAGLGVKGGCYEPLPGETYKDCVKKMTFARYHEISDHDQVIHNK